MSDAAHHSKLMTTSGLATTRPFVWLCPVKTRSGLRPATSLGADGVPHRGIPGSSHPRGIAL